MCKMTEIETTEGGQKDVFLRRANIKKTKKHIQYWSSDRVFVRREVSEAVTRKKVSCTQFSYLSTVNHVLQCLKIVERKHKLIYKLQINAYP